MAKAIDRYTYRVTWSEEDSEYVGLCAEFPSLSWLEATPEAALTGIRSLVGKSVADLKRNQPDMTCKGVDATESRTFHSRREPPSRVVVAAGERPCEAELPMWRSLIGWLIVCIPLTSAPSEQRTELFQDVTATNTSDLVGLREAALRQQPKQGEWSARSRVFVFPWEALNGDVRNLATLPLQITLFDGVVCIPVTSSISLIYGEDWGWIAHCEGTGETISLSIRPSEHIFSGSVFFPDESIDATISSIAPKWGVIYQLDNSKIPDDMQGGAEVMPETATCGRATFGSEAAA
jgi:predicted RNase H-like HicB family nuclease